MSEIIISFELSSDMHFGASTLRSGIGDSAAFGALGAKGSSALTGGISEFKSLFLTSGIPPICWRFERRMQAYNWLFFYGQPLRICKYSHSCLLALIASL